MSPLWGHLSGVITVILLLSFIGTWIWVWSARHKRKYDALARLPMDDEAHSNANGRDEEMHP
ncbi:MAG: cbb3-type cytochrome c oxidase subunit 3 [Dokdonella sp.]|uniref:cbb3-type cytochrome oxidase subunit 3 n=1 Tax=Dokdonella sp. TaxID=2291710 RepID=UPI002BF8A87F|nr:cbb3-type cytochrome c oxidase subunit 3 [Dokdonella sp.]HOX70580.1 cbb3-type cytochrome c oxidase subunit 3 [Dokdonella sp.]HPN80234.1 cbb3-type cytochrome c oxidase subunit 3 [Dokdonella sp.]